MQKMLMKYAGIASILAVLGGVAAGSALAAPKYSATALGYDFTPMDMNNSGTIVGYYEDWAHSTVRAVRSGSGSMIDLSTIGERQSEASGINDSGQIVVSARFPHGPKGEQSYGRAFLLDSNGAKTDLGNLGGSNASASAINNSGQVVGWSSLTGDTEHHAFLYSGGSMSDLGTFGAAYSFSYATAINNSGQVVGMRPLSVGGGYDFYLNHGFLSSGGSMTDLGQAEPKRINDSGQVLLLDSLYGHGSIYSGGTITYLGALYTYDESCDWLCTSPVSTGLDINNSGQVVGTATYSTYSESRVGFLYTDGSIFDLNHLVEGASPGETWDWSTDLRIEAAWAINDSGQIAATGYLNGYYGIIRLDPISGPAVPVPEPEGYAMMLAGLVVIAWSKKIRRH